MKSSSEILNSLIDELTRYIDDVGYVNEQNYYNELMGDTSFLLAGLLQSHLNSFYDWNASRWVDDSLLTNVIKQSEKLVIEGVMIWGKENTTEQWTEPFHFEISLTPDNLTFKEYTFFFSDKNKPEISYEQFSKNRSYWSDGNERKWKYIINQKCN